MALTTPRMCSTRREAESLDPDEFARELRQLAMDTWRGLKVADTSFSELDSLNNRVEFLLRQTSEPPATEIKTWLRNAKRVIGARLHPIPFLRFDRPVARLVGPHTARNQPDAVPICSAGTHERCLPVRGRSRVDAG
jgi:hypothetical protein